MKFALTLTSSGAFESGKIICVKKTKKEVKELNSILSSTLGDFFIDEVGNHVYAPIVYDMSITHKELKTDKGYLMMDLMPSNDG